MIHWQYIKGSYGTSSTDQLWSYLYFTSDLRSASATQLREFVNTPILYLSQTNNATYTTDATGDCGHIITEKAYNQSIQETFKFLNHVYIDSTKHLYFNSTSNTTGGRIHYDGAFYISSLGGNITIASKDVSSPIYLKLGTTTKCLIDNDGLNLTGRLYATSYIQTASYLKADSYCEAPYFNATSDRRAKTDIQPLLINALDLVRKTQLYSFKYKETDTPSIGIIAQDIQDVNINGFKLVDNEEATGKDLDYMTIHESKLAYILWKAVQEQQKLIEDLQKEIKELKKN